MRKWGLITAILLFITITVVVVLLFQHDARMVRNSVRFRVTGWAYFHEEIRSVPVHEPLAEPIYIYSGVEGNSPRSECVTYDTNADMETLRRVMKGHFEARGAIFQSEGPTGMDFRNERYGIMVMLNTYNKASRVSVFCLDLKSVGYH